MILQTAEISPSRKAATEDEKDRNIQGWKTLCFVACPAI